MAKMFIVFGLFISGVSSVLAQSMTLLDCKMTKVTSKAEDSFLDWPDEFELKTYEAAGRFYFEVVHGTYFVQWADPIEYSQKVIYSYNQREIASPPLFVQSVKDAMIVFSWENLSNN